MTSEPSLAEIETVHLRSFGYALATLQRLFRDRVAETLTGTGLHMGHVVLLATLRAQRELHGESTLTQTRLGQLTGIEKSSLVLFLDALEKQGWVERRHHPGDRRAHIVHLTDEGARRFEAVAHGLYVQERRNLAVLSEGEQVGFLEMMSRLIAHLRSAPAGTAS